MSKTSPTPLTFAHWYDPRKSTRDLGSGAGSALHRRRVSCSPFHCVCAPTTPDLPPLTALHGNVNLLSVGIQSPQDLARYAASLRNLDGAASRLTVRYRSLPTTDLLGSGVVGPTLARRRRQRPNSSPDPSFWPLPTRYSAIGGMLSISAVALHEC